MKKKRINTLTLNTMSKTWGWIISIFAVLGLGAAITLLVLWMKEKKKNEAANTDAPASTTTASTDGVAQTGTFAITNANGAAVITPEPRPNGTATVEAATLKKYAN